MDKEYIDREAAKKAIFEYICGHTMSKFLSRELLDASKEGAEGAMNELDYVPAADVSPVVHGQFLRQISGIRERQEYHDSLPEGARDAVSRLYGRIEGERVLTPGEENERRNAVLVSLGAV